DGSRFFHVISTRLVYLYISVHIQSQRRPPHSPYTTLFRSPLASTAMLLTVILPLPPKLLDHCAAPAELNFTKNMPWPIKPPSAGDRKSTRLNSSHGSISYDVFCLKKKKRMMISNVTIFIQA